MTKGRYCRVPLVQRQFIGRLGRLEAYPTAGLLVIFVRVGKNRNVARALWRSIELPLSILPNFRWRGKVQRRLNFRARGHCRWQAGNVTTQAFYRTRAPTSNVLFLKPTPPALYSQRATSDDSTDSRWQ